MCNFTVPGQDTYTAYNIDEYEFFNYVYSNFQICENGCRNQKSRKSHNGHCDGRTDIRNQLHRIGFIEYLHRYHQAHVEK